ncbi:sugar phosphate nucleotidyltransferase [Zooshikella ganghwensis]|uniref:sugar phosphate nucleotidyltransferase n=1 Tax=Zooshikella ganghwensis TaxID=202772 RepID=UPI000412C21F|nr:NDP-sugar synthase [Zooshikella ganghwensis]
MQAIVFANRCGKELYPLNEFYCPAMLPILGKPVLEHCIEELKVNNITEIFLVTKNIQNVIKNYFKCGIRWGLIIHYITCDESDSLNSIKQQLSSKLKLPFLAARGDILRGTYDWSLSNEDKSTAYVNMLNKPLGLMKVYDKISSIDCIKWPLKNPEDFNKAQINCPFKNYDLKSISAYHQLSLNEITDMRSLIPSGIEQSFNLIKGKRSIIQKDSIVTGKTYVGDHSYVDCDTLLHGQNSIGHECFVDKSVQISNCIILDDTFIGAGIKIKNSIVCQNKIIYIDSPKPIKISTPYFVSKNKPENISFFKIKNIFSKLLKSSALS